MSNARNLAKLDVDTSGDVAAGSLGNVPPSIVRSATAPSNPGNGDFWYDTDDYQFKFYDGTQWRLIKSAFSATGGTVTESQGYRYHTFTSSGTFTVTKGSTEADVLIVAGGGGGGAWVGGGGGAGGLVYSTFVSVFSGTNSVIVGAGGVGALNDGSYTGMPNSTKGGNSSCFGLTVAIGGGEGASHTYSNTHDRVDGGSGGGNSGPSHSVQGLGTAGQGNNGGIGYNTNPWPTGGGGGAGGAGQNYVDSNTAGSGGIGRQFSDFASATNTGHSGYYAGGGGGGKHDAGGSAGVGGLGGGGNGLVASTAKAGNGMSNTGGGGGGNGNAGDVRSEGGNGGSGIVIIRYAI